MDDAHTRSYYMGFADDAGVDFYKVLDSTGTLLYSTSADGLVNV